LVSIASSFCSPAGVSLDIEPPPEELGEPVPVDPVALVPDELGELELLAGDVLLLPIDPAAGWLCA
jgi:hypothetical protein